MSTPATSKGPTALRLADQLGAELVRTVVLDLGPNASLSGGRRPSD